MSAQHDEAFEAEIIRRWPNMPVHQDVARTFLLDSHEPKLPSDGLSKKEYCAILDVVRSLLEAKYGANRADEDEEEM